MSHKALALVGSWDWDGTSTTKGLNIFEHNLETGHLEFISNDLPDVKVGNQLVVSNKNIVYFVEEIKHTKERQYGGGGYVIAGKLNDENKLEVISYEKTLSPNPSGCIIDPKQKYMIVVHHTSTRNTATKLYRQPDGSIEQKIEYDDAAVVLFRLNEDGSIGQICDYDVHPPTNDKNSLLHSIYIVPDKELYIVADKGLDKVYSYKIDEENDKLVFCDEVFVGNPSYPRYFAFHPNKNIFYGNNESNEYMYVYTYDSKSGKLSKIGHVSLLDGTQNKEEICMASDIVITPDAKYVYVVLRGIDRIAMLDLENPSSPVLKQSIYCGGRYARGLAISDNGKYLYSCNTESDNITIFDINEGYLCVKEIINVSRPANIKFLNK